VMNRIIGLGSSPVGNERCGTPVCAREANPVRVLAAADALGGSSTAFRS